MAANIQDQDLQQIYYFYQEKFPKINFKSFLNAPADKNVKLS